MMTQKKNGAGQPEQSFWLQSGKTLRLSDAAQAFLETVAVVNQSKYARLLVAFDSALGTHAPLLAYTKLTGEVWLHSLPAKEQRQARQVLDEFRAFLRDEGWFDAARPVNQFD